MPLYEYECKSCHRRTEKIQKFSDAELTVCPHCGGPLERTITAAAISFKGGGWYADGYASHKPAASGEGSSGDSGGGSDSGSSGAGDSSATMKPSSGEGGGKSESAKPAEAAKPAAASSAPAPASSPKA